MVSSESGRCLLFNRKRRRSRISYYARFSARPSSPSTISPSAFATVLSSSFPALPYVTSVSVGFLFSLIRPISPEKTSR